MGLGAVLDQQQAVAIAEGPDPLHGGRLAVKVHSDHGAGSLGDRRLDAVGIKAGLMPHIHERGPGADAGDRFGRGDPGDGGHDYLITGPDPQGLEGYLDGIGAICAAHTVGRAIPGRKGLLKAPGPGAGDEGGGGDHLGHGGIDLRLDLAVLGVEVEEGNRHAGRFCRKSELTVSPSRM